MSLERDEFRFIRDAGKDPVRWALENATLDDESETEEERSRATEADADFKAGRMSMDELKKELDL